MASVSQRCWPFSFYEYKMYSVLRDYAVCNMARQRVSAPERARKKYCESQIFFKATEKSLQSLAPSLKSMSILS